MAAKTTKLSRMLFLGFVYPAEMQDYLIRNERGTPQIAANKLGWMLVRGIEHAFGEPVDILSVLAVSRYPLFSKVFIGPPQERRENGAQLRFVPFINAPLLKRLFIAAAAFWLLIGWLWRTRKTAKRAVTVYAMYTPTVLAALLGCRLFHVPCVLIVPDLPEFMAVGQVEPRLFGWARRLNRWLVYFCSERMDGYILVSRHMSDKLRLNGKPSAVVEGCVDAMASVDGEPPETQTTEQVVMYAGGLTEAYGVGALLQGFMTLPGSDARLWLCGRGELEAEIRRCAANDSRIHYFGPLSNAEVLRRERQATVLINPRPSHGEFTRYSFPSKNLEYLSTGRPVIVSRLPGMPEEYFDYVYPLEDESAQGVAAALRETLGKPRAELNAFGERGRTFVLQQKNFRKQGEKVRRVLEDVLRRHSIGAN